jgi:UDP-N-acetyl-2-amino-2-deoxyglucuronate dehydrogenase
LFSLLFNPFDLKKFAIIGCGSIAERHAEIISKVGRLVAVCDTVAERLEKFETEYQAIGFLRSQDLLAAGMDLDVVVVCSPNGLHALHSIEALKAGFHVLCEKPMSIRKFDCQAMMQAAKLAKRKLFIVKQNRFNPPVQALKALLDSKELGKIYNIQLNCLWNRNIDYYSNPWKGTLDMDGGILFTQFSHFIDLILWMFGPLQEFKGFAKKLNPNLPIEFEDTVILSTKFKNGRFIDCIGREWDNKNRGPILEYHRVSKSERAHNFRPSRK